MNVMKFGPFAVLFAIIFFSLNASAQLQCPMGMETHYQPAIFYTLPGNGICHLRLWDSKTAWIDLEPSNGVYNWTTLDKMLSVAQALNVDVMYTFAKVPGWASSNPTDTHCTDMYKAGDCAPPIDVDSGDGYFKAFVTALMQHAGTKISYFEMWNEPYNPPYWDGTGAQLATVVSDGAQIIRSMNPNAVILTPSMSPWKNHQVFLTTFFDAIQGKTNFDIFAMHDYTWGGPPEKIVSEVKQVKAFQAAMGMQNLPLWSSEGSDKDWSTFTDQQKQDFIPRYYALELNQGSQRHYWYSWDDKNVGMIMGTAAAKVYATMGTWFTGRTPMGCVLTGTRYVCTFRDTINHQMVWLTQGTGTYATTASSYETPDGVIHSVEGGSIPISTTAIFILQ